MEAGDLRVRVEGGAVRVASVIMVLTWLWRGSILSSAAPCPARALLVQEVTQPPAAVACAQRGAARTFR